MLKTNCKGRATMLSQTLLTSGLLGGAALFSLGAGTAQAAWDLHPTNGYACTVGATAGPGICDFGGSDPTPTPVARPGSGLYPEDKILTLLGQTGLETGDTIAFTKQTTKWEFDLDFQTDRSETFLPSGTLSYRIDITDPDYFFDQSQLSSLLSQIPATPVGPFTVTKEVFSTPFTGSPIITLINNEVPAVAGTLIASGPIGGSTIYVRDTWSISAGSTTILDAIQNNFTQKTGTPAPGPLPLLGAGAAFGFSRQIRRRIRRSSLA